MFLLLLIFHVMMMMMMFSPLFTTSLYLSLYPFGRGQKPVSDSEMTPGWGYYHKPRRGNS